MCAGLQNEYTRIQGPHAHQTQSGVSCHGQSVNSMFANVCSHHLELHASSCGRILDGHLTFVTRQARHRLSQSFMARAGFEAKPLMIAQHSIIAISDVQFMIIYSFFLCIF